VRRLILSGKAHPPSLPEFMRLCRTVGHTDDIPDISPANRLPAITHEWDRWVMAGNRRLLRYITTKIPASAQRYGHRDTREFAANVNTLVAMKNRWVELMQRSATEDGVPSDEQNECWAECMRMAEEILAQEKAA